MPNDDKLECAIYADVSLSSTELAGHIANAIGGSVDGSTVITDVAAFDIRRSDDFDPKHKADFPDGFLYFRQIIEVYMRDAEQSSTLADLVSKLLELLWGKGWPAVAACDFEERLPERGGYKSNQVPWAKAETG
jgi:hypothetical protein